ncbi:MAG: type I-G CRISPR-associated helicase/endonuclease Cas3g, partial [Vicinamibacterales bacterium]
MKPLKASDFSSFFRRVYRQDPFPWQQRLAAEVLTDGWPDVIALPTASGKTSVIDIAVFSLACQWDLPSGERRAPRRIFFVVDRRIVVDAVFERAQLLASALAEAKEGVVGVVAEKLRRLAGGSEPLGRAVLRGGLYRDDAWARTPTQPMIVASTVDQVGSRLLYRGYGLSPASHPLHAGLIGNDSLIVVDEAHCSEPFAQTLHAIERYRAWGERPPALPFAAVIMSATPPKRGRARVFRLDADDREHAELGARIRVAKPVRLIAAERGTSGRITEGLIATLAGEAEQLARGSEPKAVAIIANRVASAIAVYERLAARTDADAVLLTGRMRPLDRYQTERDLQKRLTVSGRDKHPLPRTLFVVATQCIEVGADFDFDAMVTECASLDALRQRFGRLNRAARLTSAPGIVVVRPDQTQPLRDLDEADPVYGNALPETWQWLSANARDGVVDFGIAALDRLMARNADRATLDRLIMSLP